MGGTREEHDSRTRDRFARYGFHSETKNKENSIEPVGPGLVEPTSICASSTDSVPAHAHAHGIRRDWPTGEFTGERDSTAEST